MRSKNDRGELLNDGVWEEDFAEAVFSGLRNFENVKFTVGALVDREVCDYITETIVLQL